MQPRDLRDEQLVFQLPCRRRAAEGGAVATIVRIVGHQPFKLLLVSAPACAALVLTVRYFRSWGLSAMLDAPLMLTGAASVLALSALAVRGGRLTRGLSWLGRNTLPIYVMHLPVLIVATMLPKWAALVARLGAITPVMMTAATIAMCLAGHAILVRGVGRYLFEPPPQRREHTR